MHVRRTTVCSFVSVALLLAACTGGGSRGASPTTRSTAPAPAPAQSAGVAFVGRDLPLEQVLAQAQSSRKPALLCFLAEWCGYCRMLESQTLSDPSVGAHLAAYTVARYDADSPVGRTLVKRYGLTGFPSLVRVDAQGNKVAAYEGFDLPADFVRRVPRP
jgi:thiol:disulfide interchange protein